ncbi:MAG TPA: serine hydrolase, partial [Thermodesulfobacteriota bacterium]|nr:serine hydrolase [Thermodesulfobacteriota bacterium]
PMASLTKLMTALVFLERGHLDDTVTVSAAASRETGARLGLKRGERMRADFLLTAALVGSANDACRALAEHSGKDEPGFIELMNRRAAELGMKGTHFTNASGHDHERHYSTARDLATLAEAAMRNTAIREKVKLVDAAVFTDQGRSFAVSNKNELIGRYPGAIGVKSGFTSKAGKCLIAAAERDGFRALLVFLNAPNRWWEAEAMLDEAFRRGGKQGGSGP